MLKEGIVVTNKIVNVLIALTSPGPPATSMGTLRAEDETFMRDRLHVILVRVAGAEESVLHRDVVHDVPEDGGLHLGRVVEPLDLNPHVADRSLPHGVNPPDIGSVRPARGEKTAQSPTEIFSSALVMVLW